MSGKQNKKNKKDGFAEARFVPYVLKFQNAVQDSFSVTARMQKVSVIIVNVSRDRHPDDGDSFHISDLTKFIGEIAFAVAVRFLIATLLIVNKLDIKIYLT